MPWLGHNKKPNVGNDWRMMLQRVTEKLWIAAAEEAVEHAKRNNLLRQEVIDAENELAKAVQAKNSRYQVQKVGLNVEARIASPATRMVELMFNRTMNEGDP